MPRRLAPSERARPGSSGWASPTGPAQKVEDLSKGMQQKVQFIGTLLHDPELVILDEPFSGLDPVNSQVMKDVVVDLARQGRTVLFSTHIMEQAEKMCERIVIISRGRKVVDGTMAEVKREVRRPARRARLPPRRGTAAPVLRDRTPGGQAGRLRRYGRNRARSRGRSRPAAADLVRARSGIRGSRSWSLRCSPFSSPRWAPKPRWRPPAEAHHA